MMRVPTAFEILGRWVAAIDGAGTRKSLQRLTRGLTPGLRWRGGALIRRRQSTLEAYRVELTPAAMNLVERFAALVAASLEEPCAKHNLVALVEQWCHHWSQVFRHPVGGDQFRRRH